MIQGFDQKCECIQTLSVLAMNDSMHAVLVKVNEGDTLFHSRPEWTVSENDVTVSIFHRFERMNMASVVEYFSQNL